MPCSCCGGKPDAEAEQAASGSKQLAKLQKFNDEMEAHHLSTGEALTSEEKAKLKEEEAALLAKLALIDAGTNADDRTHVGKESDAGSAELNPRRASKSTQAARAKSGDFANAGPDIPACLAHAAVQLQMAYPAAQQASGGREPPVAVPVGNMHTKGGTGGAVICRVHAFSAFRVNPKVP